MPLKVADTPHYGAETPREGRTNRGTMRKSRIQGRLTEHSTNVYMISATNDPIQW